VSDGRGDLRVLFLSEGDPENPSQSGSGTPTSVIEHLRAGGDVVRSADVDLRGPQRLVGAALTYARERERWRARYHLAPPLLRMRSRNAAAALRRLRGEVDAVLQYGGTFGVGAGAGVPYFLFCDNNILNSAEQPRSWAAQMEPGEVRAAVEWERALYAGARAIFTFSEFARASFLRHYGLPPERVVVVGSGPNLPLARVPAGRQPRPAGHAPTILFVGRDYEHKGGPVVVDAFRRVRRKLPDARLLIAGPAALDLDEPGVEFLGYLRKEDPADFERLLRAYGDADVFCLPTRYESFGIAFVEAMWFGLPVVAPGHWAIPEIVEDGVTGHLVPREDAGTYADHLLRLLRDGEVATAMGERGRARARARFSWDQVTRAMRVRMRHELGVDRGGRPP
jgi:glycosyltransferase involved in cell wall biosynthesis